MQIHIEVTQDDIDQGEPGEQDYCAIARALTARTNTLWSVCDDSVPQLVAHRWPDSLEVPLPPEAVQFVRLFDNHDRVEPFAFDLELPEVTV